MWGVQWELEEVVTVKGRERLLCAGGGYVRVGDDVGEYGEGGLVNGAKAFSYVDLPGH